MAIPVPPAVAPYQFSPMTLANAYLGGTQVKSPWAYLGEGIGTGMEIGMRFRDRYGKEAIAAREREARMQELQIQQAQEALKQAGLRTKIMEAEFPYANQKIATGFARENVELAQQVADLEKATIENNTAKANFLNSIVTQNQRWAQTNLRISQLSNTIQQQEIAKKNTQQMTDDRVTYSKLMLDAMNTKNTDKFMDAYKSLQEYVLKYGFDEFAPMQDAFSNAIKAAGLQNDPKLAGIFSRGTPYTLANVDSQLTTLPKIAGEAQQKILRWADTWAKGGIERNPGQFEAIGDWDTQNIPGTSPQTTTTATPSKNEIPRFADDWSSLKLALTSENVYGMKTSPMDIAGRTQYVGRRTDGGMDFRDSYTGKIFSLDGADGRRLMQLVQATNEMQQAEEGMRTYAAVKAWMNQNGTTTISPELFAKIFNAKGVVGKDFEPIHTPAWVPPQKTQTGGIPAARPSTKLPSPSPSPSITPTPPSPSLPAAPLSQPAAKNNLLPDPEPQDSAAAKQQQQALDRAVAILSKKGGITQDEQNFLQAMSVQNPELYAQAKALFSKEFAKTSPRQYGQDSSGSKPPAAKYFE